MITAVINEHYAITSSSPIHVCRHCGALVDEEFLGIHVKWHEDRGPVKAFREHWRRS